MLSGFLSDPKVFGDKYMTPAEIERETSTSASKKVDSASKKVESASAKVRVPSEDEESDDGLVVVEVESEDERSNWDCETVVSTLSNLDNHPGKISAPSKPRSKAPSLGKVLEDKESNGGMIKLRGKQSLPTDFLPLRPQAEKAKQLKNVANDSETKKTTTSRAGETPEQRKARKAAVKEERREARASKKALKILYKDESQKAQYGAANTGVSGIHLP